MQPTTATASATIEECSRQIVLNHLSAFQAHELDALLSDYTIESVLITQEAIFVGQQEIKGFFETLILHFPKGHSNFILDKVVVNNELVYIVWHAQTPSLHVAQATDTFILKNGKIHQQTFAGQMTFL
jgi:ketosteroid isomerase-like protein